MLSNNENAKCHDENNYLSAIFMSTIGDRDEQQDCFGYDIQPEEGLFIVCDGMGGSAGGRMASEIAVGRILRDFREAEEIENVTEFLSESAKIASEEISKLKTPEGNSLSAGSTLVAVLIRGRQLYWCSVGDSRAYLYRGGQFVQFTLDHTYRTVLNGQLKAGLIDLPEYTEESSTKKAEALISYLGMSPLELIDSGNEPIELISGDKILIMSDGLYKLVSDEEVRRITENFASNEEALNVMNLKALKAAKREKRSRDNMTVAMIQIK